MRFDLNSLRKHPLAACLGAALTLGGPLLAAEAPPVMTVRPLHVLHDAGTSGLAALIGRAPDGSTTRRVTNCNDSGPGSLRDLVAASESHDFVDLTDLRCSTITLTSGAIEVTAQYLHVYSRNVGAVTISGGGRDRIFNHNIQGFGRFYVQGLHLTDGYSTGNGGCVAGYNLYIDETTVSNCEVHTSDSTALGGAIYAKQNLRVTDTDVTASYAHSDANEARGGGIYLGGDLNASYSTISGNKALSDTTRSFGGGALVRGHTFVTGSTIDGNRSSNSAGLSLVGGRYKTAEINNSTISGNTATVFIGGLYSDEQLVLSNSTIAFNCAGASQVVPGYIAAVGLHNYYTAPEIESTIIADNTICEAARPDGMGGEVPYDVSLYGSGPITGANNLIITSTVTLPADTLRDDPQLQPLADNGGRTRTHALASTSPAIDKGNNLKDLGFDQRYFWNTRVVGAAADIGAFELQSSGPTHQVKTCDDDGDGSLRSIIALSASGDSVDLSALSCSTITLGHGAIEVPQGNLTLIGPGAQALTIDGGNLDRIFRHTGSGTLDVSGLRLVNGYGLSETGGLLTGGCVSSQGRVRGDDMTIAGCKGHSDTIGCIGGGVGALDIELSNSTVSHNSCTSATQIAGGGGLGSALLTLDRSTVSDNIATSVSSYSLGGGIVTLGDGTVTSSTISGNRADRGGGDFFIRMTMTNSTISGNAAYGKGGGAYGIYLTMSNSTVTANSNTTNVEPAAGGIFVRGSSELNSTIVFGNTLDATPYDFGGIATLLLGANNLIGTSTIIPPLDTITDDPHLGPLQDNGGPTFTHALLPGSPAIDTGSNAADLADDQRGDGFLRVGGDAADIGAYEVQPVTIDDHIFVDGFDPESLR